MTPLYPILALALTLGILAGVMVAVLLDNRDCQARRRRTTKTLYQPGDYQAAKRGGR